MFRTLFEVLKYAFSELANKVKRKRIIREHNLELARIKDEERRRELRKAALAEELHLREQERIVSKHDVEESPYE